MSRNSELCFRVRHGVALGMVCVLVSLTGCSSNLHGPWQTAFSRFWGFDRASATLKAAPQAVAESFESMVESIHRDPNAMDCSKDPFLDMQVTPSMQANPTKSSTVATASGTTDPKNDSGSVVQTLFQQPPVEPNELGAKPTVQLAQHQPEVGEISSTEKSLPIVTPGEPNSSKNGVKPHESSLDELKDALQQDAKTRSLEKPPASDPALIRQRIDKMMQIANSEAARGEYAIALRMAMAAQQLVDTSGVFFGPEEQKPADTVANLRARMKRRQQAVPKKLVPLPPVETESEIKYTWKPAATDVASTVESLPTSDEPPTFDEVPSPVETTEPTQPVADVESTTDDPFLTSPAVPQIASRELKPGILSEPTPLPQRVQANQGSVIELNANAEIAEAPPFPSQVPTNQDVKTESVFDEASKFAAVKEPIIDFVPRTPAAPEPPLPTDSIDSARNLLIDPSARELVGQEPSRNVDWNDDQEATKTNPQQAANPLLIPSVIIGAAIVIGIVMLNQSRRGRRR